ncbi:MAG: hypothetical protein JKY03_14915 [Aureispira sp.]|nr:hypothetical protein [Aureispira sp.]
MFYFFTIFQSTFFDIMGIMLFYFLVGQVEVENFEAGILLFIIMATSIIMTIAMVYDKRRNQQALNKASGISIGYST